MAQRRVRERSPSRTCPARRSRAGPRFAIRRAFKATGTLPAQVRVAAPDWSAGAWTVHSAETDALLILPPEYAYGEIGNPPAVAAR